jgi:hypothetical protein
MPLSSVCVCAHTYYVAKCESYKSFELYLWGVLFLCWSALSSSAGVSFLNVRLRSHNISISILPMGWLSMVHALGRTHYRLTELARMFPIAMDHFVSGIQSSIFTVLGAQGGAFVVHEPGSEWGARGAFVVHEPVGLWYHLGGQRLIVIFENVYTPVVRK